MRKPGSESKSRLGLVFFTLAFLLGTQILCAQMQVRLEIPRTLYIRYEPILVNVMVTNLSGRPMVLQDTEDTPWFGFLIETAKGRPISPRSSAFSGHTIAINPGETLRRRVNLTPLYALDDYGRHTVQAAVYDASSGTFFRSAAVPIEITEGRLLWQQKLGHPVEGTPRHVSLLAHRLSNSTGLYLRITNPDAPRVYCTHRLGPLVTHAQPKIEIDQNNELHILHMQAPKRFVYSHVGLNGEIRQRQAYEQTQTKPTLIKSPDGMIQVAGGTPYQPQDPSDQPPASVSDRPVPLPPPTMAPQETEPKKPGGINLWPFRKSSE